MADFGTTKQDVGKWKVPELKAYLQRRRMALSQKRKGELVDLVEKALDLSLEPVEDGEKPEEVIAKRLQLKEGLLPCPKTLQSD